MPDQSYSIVEDSGLRKWLRDDSYGYVALCVFAPKSQARASDIQADCIGTEFADGTRWYAWLRPVNKGCDMSAAELLSAYNNSRQRSNA